MSIYEISSKIKQFLFSINFDLVGFSEAKKLKKESELLRSWLSKGYQADMDWIEKSFHKRVDPFEILPEAKSIISVGMNYFQKVNGEIPKDSGKISVYAWGKDYHKVFEKKFKQIKKFLNENYPESINRFYVDYGPTMDKVWAVKGGLGWMGKHTNVINTSIGSWFFIGTIITSLELVYDEPISDMCGKCRICIDACPTGAIVEDYVVDANKCISYQTIENKKEIPNNLKGKFQGFIFGCDICQEVCPWNKKLQIETHHEDFASNKIQYLKFEEINLLNEDEFKVKFNGKSLLRAGLKKIKSNFEFIKH